MGREVIVLGNDHTNSMGVIQSLGIEGFHVVAFVWGVKTGLLRSSRYTKELYCAKDAQGCIDKMLKVYSNTECLIPIIACCDTAALVLEENASRLPCKFLYESARGAYSLTQLQEKNLQVKLAIKAGFYVPKTVEVLSVDKLNNDLPFDGPYLIKPLKSVEGAKKDIIVCNDFASLQSKASTVLSHTPRILVQQYIDKDYELSILGCAMRNGTVLIPAKEIKHTLYPPKTGLESKAIMTDLNEEYLKKSINTLIEEIGYVGLFSVELMHNHIDDKYYFTEINLRNDGAQPFMRKYGVNLPTIHVFDLLECPYSIPEKKHPGLFLWEMHHFESLRSRTISLKTWLSDIVSARGYLLTCKKDYLPFFKQFETRLLRFRGRKRKEIEYYH